MFADAMDIWPVMLKVLGTWGAVFAALTGLGLSLRRLWRIQGVATRDVLMSFWTGFALLVLFLQVWHFFLPVNALAAAVIAVAGAAGLVWNGRRLLRWAKPMTLERLMTLAALAVIAAWTANLSLEPCWWYDTGLYHLNHIRWNTSFAIVPGLANLHDRLGFNSSALLYDALLEVGPWRGRSWNVANGLLIFVLMAQSLHGAARLLNRDEPFRMSSAFDLMLLGPVAGMAEMGMISSAATDLPVAVVGLVAASALVEFVLCDDPPTVAGGDRPARSGRNGPFILLMLALGVCLKLTLAAFAVGGVAVLVIVRLTRAGRSDPPRPPEQAGAEAPARRGAVWAAVLSVMLVGTWMARNAVLSGYPLYPLSVFPLPVEWRMPREQVDLTRYWILRWARQPGPVEPVGWQWVGPWLKMVLPFLKFPLALSALGGLAAGVGVFLRRGKRLRARQCLILAPIAFALLVWFLSAPGVWFGTFLFWILAATLAALAIHLLPPLVGLSRVVVFAWALVLAWGVIRQATGPVYPDRAGGLYPVPSVPMTSYTTLSGLRIYYPFEGDQCWDSPLPSSPEPSDIHRRLRLRRPGELDSGFVVDPPGAPSRPWTLEKDF